MSAAGEYRVGFTAIELLVVISIMALLATLAARAVIGLASGQAVATAVGRIEVVARTAHGRALRAAALNAVPADADASFASKRYGVVLARDIPESSGRWAVALTWGASAATATVMRGADGKPLLLQPLPESVSVQVATDAVTVAPLTGTLGWMYDHRSGLTLAAAGTLGVIGSDDDLGPLATAPDVTRLSGRLVVTTGDVNRAMAIRLLPTGELLVQQHLEP